MKKIVLIALTVFLSVVASAQNFDNGCKFSPTHGTAIEAVQLDAYQADVLSIGMNVQYEMPAVCIYSQTSAIVYFDFQTLAIIFSDTGETASLAMADSFTNYNTDFSVHRQHKHSGPMIRQVQAA